MEKPRSDTPPIPQAPSEAAWAALTDAERAVVVRDLPSWIHEAELAPPEGDPHGLPIQATRDALSAWFRGQGRGVYIGADLGIYYPAEPRFAPDVFVALDVEPGERDKWVVSHEGKGPDWILEVLYSGDRKKDLVFNVARYARLGVPEYFVFDRRDLRLHGWRLPHPGARTYEVIVPQFGRYPVRTLGLELTIEHDRPRFYKANAPLLQTAEIADGLRRTVDQLEARAESLAEARAAEAEARAAEAEARALAESRVAELEAELARLRGERT